MFRGFTWKIRLVGVAVGCVGVPDLTLGEHRWDRRWPQGVLLMVAARRAAAVADDCPASPPPAGTHATISEHEENVV